MADASDRTEQDGRRPGAESGSLSLSVGEPAAVVRSRVLACYEQHGEELGRFVMGVVRDPDRAGDVMQATLSRALELGHTARPETLKGWLFRVAFHEAMAVRRRERAGETARRRLAELGRASAPGPGPPDEALIRVETARVVRRALRDLPEEQRKVVVARVYQDKTFAQIARESGLPLGTVLTRMRLALDKLRRALRPGVGDEDGDGDR
jgi:RNA polymerase sigma-70 factor (ECF subfamily)